MDPIDLRATNILHQLGKGEALDPGDAEYLRSLPDGTIQDGLALQLAVLDLFEQSGHRVGGWKVGLTSRGGRDAMGPGIRPFGYVLADRVLPSRASVPLDEVRGKRVEPEIFLSIGNGGSRDARRLDDGSVPSVARIGASFEIVGRSLPEEMPRSVRIGNRMSQWGIVVGEGTDDEVELDALRVSFSRDGEKLGESGTGPSVLDDPHASLGRLVEYLQVFGRGLRPGEYVITGSILPSAVIEGPGTWTAEFGPLGEVELTVAD